MSCLMSAVLVTGCAIDEEVVEETVQEVADPSIPPSLGPLEAWFDGTRGITTLDGQVISWDDRSGNGHILGRASFDPPPMTYATYPGAPKDSNRAVCFGSELPTAGAIASGLVTSGITLRPPFTIAIALRPTQTAAAFALSGAFAPTISVGQSLEVPAWPPTILVPQTRLRATAGIGDTFTEIAVANDPITAPHVMVAIFDGPRSQLFVDGAPRGAVGDLTGAPLSGLVLSPAARPFSGCIGEVLVYRTNIGAVNATALASYLRSHYGP